MLGRVLSGLEHVKRSTLGVVPLCRVNLARGIDQCTPDEPFEQRATLIALRGSRWTKREKFSLEPQTTETRYSDVQ